jgi:hypothetical protein
MKGGYEKPHIEQTSIIKELLFFDDDLCNGCMCGECGVEDEPIYESSVAEKESNVEEDITPEDEKVIKLHVPDKHLSRISEDRIIKGVTELYSMLGYVSHNGKFSSGKNVVNVLPCEDEDNCDDCTIAGFVEVRLGEQDKERENVHAADNMLCYELKHNNPIYVVPAIHELITSLEQLIVIRRTD